MPKDDTFQLAVAVQALAARQRIQSIALRESLAVLSTPQVAQVREPLHQRVRSDAQSRAIAIPGVDEAVADELSLILKALSEST